MTLILQLMNTQIKCPVLVADTVVWGCDFGRVFFFESGSDKFVLKVTGGFEYLYHNCVVCFFVIPVVTPLIPMFFISGYLNLHWFFSLSTSVTLAVQSINKYLSRHRGCLVWAWHSILTLKCSASTSYETAESVKTRANTWSCYFTCIFAHGGCSGSWNNIYIYIFLLLHEGGLRFLAQLCVSEQVLCLIL